MKTENTSLINNSNNPGEILTLEAYNNLITFLGLDDLKNTAPLTPSPYNDLVSVIIPTYNRINMLLRCINSVLMQTHQKLEIIVVDDASSDDTHNTIYQLCEKEPRVKYFRNEYSIGPGESRHKGYMECNGKYVIYIDDDDFYIEPRFFENAISIFQKFPNCALVCGNSINYYTSKNNYKYFPYPETGFMKNDKYLSGFMITYRKPSSIFPAMFSKNILENADFGALNIMNDTLIYLKALCFGDIYFSNNVIGVYLIHNKNISMIIPPHYPTIETLDEKYKILCLARERFSNLTEDWSIHQMTNTKNHFLSNSNLTIEQKN